MRCIHFASVRLLAVALLFPLMISAAGKHPDHEIHYPLNAPKDSINPLTAENTIYAYEYDHIVEKFVGVRSMAVHEALARINNGSARKMYTLLLPLKDETALAVINDDLQLISPTYRMRDIQRNQVREAENKFLNKKVKPEDRENCIVFVLGYYVARDRAGISPPKLYFYQDLLGFPRATSSRFLTHLFFAEGYRSSHRGVDGIDDLLRRRVEVLDGLVQGRISPVMKKLDLSVTIPSAVVKDKKQIQERIDADADPSFSIADLSDPSKLIVDIAHALDKAAREEIEQTLNDFNRKYKQSRRIVITGYRTIESFINTVNEIRKDPSVIWMHFNYDNTIGFEWGSLIGGAGNQFICANEGVDKLPEWLAKMKVELDVPGLFQQFIGYYGSLASYIQMGEIPRKYIDPDDPGYVRWGDGLLAYALGYDDKELEKMRLSHRDEGLENMPAWRYSLERQRFAFFAGFYNSFVSLAGAGPQLVEFLSDLRCNRLKRIMLIIAWESFKRKASNVSGYWDEIKKFANQADGRLPNPVMMEYYMGHFFAAMVTVYLSTVNAGRMGVVADLLLALDPTTYLVRPALQLTKFAVKVIVTSGKEAIEITVPGLYWLGKKMLRIEGEPWSRIIRMNRSGGWVKELLYEWRLIDFIEIIQPTGEVIRIPHYPFAEQLKKLWQQGRKIFVVNESGVEQEIKDIVIYKGAGTTGAGADDAISPKITKLRALPGEKSDKYQLYVAEDENGTPIQLAVGITPAGLAGGDGNNNNGNGGNNNGNSGNDGDGPGGPGGLPRRIPVKLADRDQPFIGSVYNGKTKFRIDANDNSRRFTMVKDLDAARKPLSTYSLQSEDGGELFTAGLELQGVEWVDVVDNEGIMVLTQIDMPALLSAYSGFENIILTDALRTAQKLLSIQGKKVDVIKLVYRANGQNRSIYEALTKGGTPKEALSKTPLGEWANANEYTYVEVTGVTPGLPVATVGEVIFRKKDPSAGKNGIYALLNEDKVFEGSTNSPVAFRLKAGSNKKLILNRKIENGFEINYDFTLPDGSGLYMDHENKPIVSLIRQGSGSTLPPIITFNIVPPVTLLNTTGGERIILSDAIPLMNNLLRKNLMPEPGGIAVGWEHASYNETLYPALRNIQTPEALIEAFFQTQVGNLIKLNGFIYPVLFEHRPNKGRIVFMKERPTAQTILKLNNLLQGIGRLIQFGFAADNSNQGLAVPQPVHIREADKQKLQRADNEVKVSLYSGDKPVITLTRVYDESDDLTFYELRNEAGKKLDGAYSIPKASILTDLGNFLSVKIDLGFTKRTQELYPGLDQLIINDMYHLLSRQLGPLRIYLFIDLNDDRELNAVIFRENRSRQIQESALAMTPVGKWARGKGFEIVQDRTGRDYLSALYGNPEYAPGSIGAKSLMLGSANDQLRVTGITPVSRDSVAISLGDASGRLTGLITRGISRSESDLRDHNISKRINYNFKRARNNSQELNLEFTVSTNLATTGNPRRFLMGEVDKSEPGKMDKLVRIIQDDAYNAVKSEITGVCTVLRENSSYVYNKENLDIFNIAVREGLSDDAAARLMPTAIYWMNNGFSKLLVARRQVRGQEVIYVYFEKED